MSTLYKCPHCGSDIEIKDIVLYEDYQLEMAIRRFRIDTVITHMKVVIDPECVSVMQLLGEEINHNINSVASRAANIFDVSPTPTPRPTPKSRLETIKIVKSS